MQISWQNYKFVRTVWVWRANAYQAKMGIKPGRVYMYPANREVSTEAKAGSKAWVNVSAPLFLFICHSSCSLGVYEKATRTANSSVVGMKPPFLSSLSAGKPLSWPRLVLCLPWAVYSVRSLQLGRCARSREATLSTRCVFPFPPNPALWRFILEVPEFGVFRTALVLWFPFPLPCGDPAWVSVAFCKPPFSGVILTPVVWIFVGL